MSLEGELQRLLAAPVETPTVDFKEVVRWGSLHARIELARDVVCLANRNGGLIVLGVADRGGRFERVGLADGDDLPDPTDLGKVIRAYFDPPVQFTCTEVSVDGQRFGVIQVSEFDRVPVVCKSIGNDENNRAVVRPGYIYRRSDSMECTILDNAHGYQSLIESAVAKTGAAVRAMVDRKAAPGMEPATPSGAVAGTPATVATDAASDSSEPLRLCNLSPLDPAAVPLLDLAPRISRSMVRSRGGVIVPRSIDPSALPPSSIVREPGRILIERARDESYGRSSSLIEVTTGLRVRLREGLWEPEGTVDFTSMFAHTFACLLFASRFFEATTVVEVEVQIGLARPLGLRLGDDPSAFIGFFQTYVATSTVDLIVSRRVPVSALQLPEDRLTLGREMVTELVAYFGFALTDAAFDAHVKHVARSMPDVFS